MEFMNFFARIIVNHIEILEENLDFEPEEREIE